MNLLSIIILLRGDGIHTLSPPVLIELRTITVICEFPIVSRASELSLSKLHSGHSHRPISDEETKAHLGYLAYSSRFSKPS